MMTVTSKRYGKPRFARNGLVKVVRKGSYDPMYVEAVKYVDVANNMVFIYDGSSKTITPTYGTIKRNDEEAVNKVKVGLVTL